MTNSGGRRRQKVTLQMSPTRRRSSKATASLALNKNPRISEATRKRVLAAVESLGYVYTQRAASLRTRRSNTIGLIIKDVSNPFNAELTSGPESQLADHDYSLILATTDDDLGKQSRMLQTMLEHDVDGLILSPVAQTSTESMRQLMQFCSLVLLIPFFRIWLPTASAWTTRRAQRARWSTCILGSPAHRLRRRLRGPCHALTPAGKLPRYLAAPPNRL